MTRTIVLGATAFFLSATAAAAQQTSDFTEVTVTPQELHARLTDPDGPTIPSAFEVTTPQELHARLTDPATHPPSMRDMEDE